MKKINYSLESRYERYQEYLQLKQLPFLSKEQSTRYDFLCKQRKKDNHFSRMEHIAEQLTFPFMTDTK